MHQFHRESFGEDIHYLVAFAGPHEAMIHIHTGQTVADGAV